MLCVFIQVYRSNGVPEAEKSATLKVQLDHLDLVKAERAVYNSMRDNCKATCTEQGLHLGKATVKPASKKIRMHYSFDFAQQVNIMQ